MWLLCLCAVPEVSCPSVDCHLCLYSVFLAYGQVNLMQLLHRLTSYRALKTVSINKQFICTLTLKIKDIDQAAKKKHCLPLQPLFGQFLPLPKTLKKFLPYDFFIILSSTLGTRAGKINLRHNCTDPILAWGGQTPSVKCSLVQAHLELKAHSTAMPKWL